VSKPKKVYIKRKSEVLQTLEKKEVTVTEKKDDTATAKKEVTPEVDDDESDEEPATKRVKITKDQPPESTPSLWRGIVAKPLLLAAVSAVSFYINSVYNTNQSQTPTGFTTIKKKTTTPVIQTQNTVFATKLQTASASVVIPGFTM
jgi:uncharacterized membrane protein YcjF (UPF0283 family)